MTFGTNIERLLSSPKKIYTWFLIIFSFVLFLDIAKQITPSLEINLSIEFEDIVRTLFLFSGYLFGYLLTTIIYFFVNILRVKINAGGDDSMLSSYYPMYELEKKAIDENNSVLYSIHASRSREIEWHLFDTKLNLYLIILIIISCFVPNAFYNGVFHFGDLSITLFYVYALSLMYIILMGWVYFTSDSEAVFYSRTSR